MYFENAALWIYCAPLALASLGVVCFIGLAIIRWINEHEDSRGTRALWAVLWASGLAMLTIGIGMAAVAMGQ